MPVIFILIVILSFTIISRISAVSTVQSKKNNVFLPLARNTKNIAKDMVEVKTGIDDAVIIASDPLSDTKARLRSGDTDGLKIVFLTFDDGPSQYTGAVLDILKTYDISATFFTNLRTGDKAEAAYQRIVNEGHTLGNHTSSHDYGLYNNQEAFFADVEALDSYQLQVTGLLETSHLFRFPGGSLNANLPCVQGIVDRGYNYADWNVVAGDGRGTPEPEMVVENILEGCHNLDVSVVLCHAERKSNTLAALPTVIETLKAEGYTFLPMEKDFIYPRHLKI